MAQHKEKIAWHLFSERMAADGAPDLVIRTFQDHYRQLAEGVRGWIPENDIRPLENTPDLERLDDHTPAGRESLNKTVVIKLNGGLGTSMGLDQAKTLIVAKNGLTFLDIIVRQILHIRRHTGSRLPLILMNSFSTVEATLRALKAYPALQTGQPDIPLHFLQHRVPKVLQHNLEPAIWPSQPALEWCPPGHGDLYTALVTTGILDHLLQEGFEYALVTNADNLGATLDLNILGYFASENIPFMMEVADRTAADQKGGHVARAKTGALLLRESAQCPEADLGAFQDIRKHRYFNSNNLWMNLRALARKMAESGNILDLPLIVNRKNLDPKDTASPAVYQLETAMGAALALFPEAVALRIPRSRFAPVKTTNDLLAMRSDAYVLTEDFRVVLHPDRGGHPPVVDLDPHHYRRLDDFEKHFPHGAPSLLKCDRFAVTGPHRFGSDVVAAGSVTLRHEGKDALPVADNARLSV